jgi:hypothetical protein
LATEQEKSFVLFAAQDDAFGRATFNALFRR